MALPATAQDAPAVGRTPVATGATLKTSAQIEQLQQQAAELTRHHQFAFAADSYRKLNKLEGDHCADCLRALYAEQMQGAAYKDAAQTAVLLKAEAHGRSEEAIADFRQASALYAIAGSKPKPEKLSEVHALLTEALAAEPRYAAALYLDGSVLAHMGKMDEAKSDFARCVACVDAHDPARVRAEHFAADPELSLQRMAPAFEVTALDGTRLNLDAMGGRVVLIDFWATWCGPCNRELPHMKKIAQEFAGQPLVILSVSWDQDEARWMEFVNRNEMTWQQYRDADRQLSNLFDISAIPHYFTIDSDGVLTAEMLGEGADIEGKLRKLTARAKQAQAQTTAVRVAPAVVAGDP